MIMTNRAPVELLKRQYLQLTDPKELALPRKDILRLPDIQAQIYNGIFDESSIIYPPPECYRFRVLKRLVKALEDAIEDPEEDVGSFPLLPVHRFFPLRCLLPFDFSGCPDISSTDRLSLPASRRSQMTYRGV